jgi:hypothetical protein
MAADGWQYLYEPLTVTAGNWAESFNRHLNARAAEGWELVSAQFGEDDRYRWVDVIWRR